MYRRDTKKLIDILEGELKPSERDVKLLIDAASKNKILLQVLRTLNYNDPLRQGQEESFKSLLENVEAVSKALDGLNYTFYKLLKPVSYVPADIDILVELGDAEEAVWRLINLGYRMVVKEPYCATLSREASIIDVYVHPTLGGTIYLDGLALLEHRKLVDFNHMRIPSLEKYAEALVAATHAIYKERIYTLNDYMTVKKWMDNKTLRLAEELKCTPALKLVIKLNEAIKRGLTEAPCRIPVALWIKLLTHKLIVDSLTRSTSTNLLHALISPHGLRQLASKLTRETY